MKHRLNKPEVPPSPSRYGVAGRSQRSEVNSDLPCAIFGLRTSNGGFFNPRVLLAFALCSSGILWGIFSLAAPPSSELESSPSRKPGGTTTPANTSLPPSFPSKFGGNANRPAAVATLAEEALPPGVPLPPGAQ